MVANRKVTGRALSVPAGIALGAAVSAGVTIAGVMLVAWLLGRETLPESALGYGVMGILLLSAAAGAGTAVRRIKRQRMIMSLISGMVYFLMLLATTALFFGGQYGGVGATALVILAGSGAVGLMGLAGGGGKKRHRTR